jgi:hypothetical protein
VPVSVLTDHGVMRGGPVLMATVPRVVAVRRVAVPGMGV